jgi:hypothetical protein
MKFILFAATLLFVASTKVQATEALIFDGGGYNVYILIGNADRPAVAQVRFTPPGAKDWVHLPKEQLKIEKFDMGKRVLEMRFLNANHPDLPASFSLSVKKKKAVLSISGKKITSTFDWLDE